MAAAFVLAMIFCAANPSLASEIPVLGSIFNKMQGIFGTSDDTSLSRYQTTDLNIINCCS